MASVIRSVSSENIYHFIIRGSAKQMIFEDDSDRNLFLCLVNKYLHELGGVVYAWILMSDHVHMIVRMPLADIATLMKKLGATYFANFNKRTGRSGPVIQGRFHSEAINTNDYLMTCIRYIHQNLEKAGGSRMEETKWSSYADYASANGPLLPLETETGFPLAVFEGLENFKAFHSLRDYAVPCIDVGKTRSRMTDEEAIVYVKSLIGEETLHHIKEFDIPKRNALLATLKKHNISIRQAARLTGLGVNIVRKA